MTEVEAPPPRIALQEYHTEKEIKKMRKLRVMNGCIFFSRKIKPGIILIFVVVYWSSGLIRSSQEE